MPSNTSKHILSTSANLLGFCLFVITSFHVTNKSADSIIDEAASLIALLLSLSCFFSFVSIRTSDARKEERWEKIADYFFLYALVGIIMIIFLLVLKFIK
jgi:surface polysaccharide O-acyltransferase-like enzyme